MLFMRLARQPITKRDAQCSVEVGGRAPVDEMDGERRPDHVGTESTGVPQDHALTGRAGDSLSRSSTS